MINGPIKFAARRGDLTFEWGEGEFSVRLHRDTQRDPETLWLKTSELAWVIETTERIREMRRKATS